MTEKVGFRKLGIFVFFTGEFIFGFVILLVYILDLLPVRDLQSIVLLWLAQIGPMLSLLGVANKKSWRNRLDVAAPWFFFPLSYFIYFGVSLAKSPQYVDLFYPVSLGLFMYYVGLFFVNLKPVKNESRQGIVRRWRLIPFYSGTLIIYLLSLFALSYLLMRVGFVGFNAGAQTNRTLVISTVGGYVYYLGLLGIASMILSALYILITKAGYKSLVLFSLFIISLLLLAALGYRYWVTIPIFSMLVLINYCNRRLIAISVVFSLFAILYATIYGNYRQTGNIGLGFTVIQNVIIHEANLGVSLLYLVIGNIPLNTPFFQGRAFLMPIAAILPGRGENLGTILKESMGLHFEGGGLNATILGGFYADFGYLGIAVGMMAVGLFYGWIYRNLIIYRDEFWLVLYAFITIYLSFSLRTSLSNSFLPYMVIGTFWAFRFVNRLKTGKRGDG